MAAVPRRGPPARAAILCLVALAALPAACGPPPVFPGATWEQRSPEASGLDPAALREIERYLGGDGFIARRGYQVHAWGDPSARREVASASKALYSTFLLLAIDEGRLTGLDARVAEYEPCLLEINVEAGRPDAEITFRHLANQTSCYGVRERPGTAFSYNDWQTALFWDVLFLRVWGASYDDVDETVLRPRLMDRIGAEDAPTLMALRKRVGPGRLGISPRDFARLGLLFLHEGEWDGDRVLSAALARTAVTSPLSNAIPRTRGVPAEMCAGQRSSARNRILDQTDHLGSYSFMWWTNGVSREGRRLWPSAPTDTFAALGSRNGGRGMAVLPSLDVVIAWNGTRLLWMEDHQRSGEVHPLDRVFALLGESASTF